jgi:hypothetical protein
LNNLRNNQITAADVQALNKYVKPDFDLKNNKGYITLTMQADAMNAQALEDLELITYKPDIVGDFPEKIFPYRGAFKIKTRAQVMFVKMICQWTRIISTEKWES